MPRDLFLCSWNAHFGYIRDLRGPAVVIGEWGGFLSGSSAVWLNAFASYLSNKSMTDTFFWCLNPNSGDTGGLLQNVRRGMPAAHPGEIVRRNYSRCLPFSRAYRTGLDYA